MKYQYKTKPYPHQVKALKFLLRRSDGGRLNVPLRWGKSWVGVNYAACLYLRDGVRRALIVTVTSGLGVWEDEVGKHCPVPWRVFDHHGELLSQDPGAGDDADFLDFIVVNFPNTYQRMNTGGRSWAPVPHPGLMKFAAELVIVDEDHNIGNPTAVQSKMCRMMGRQARFRVGLTGTPWHRKPFYAFGAALFYDDGARLGNRWTHFKKRIAVFGGYNGYEVLGYRNLKWLGKKLKEFTFIEEYVPLRDPVENVIRFNLTGKNLEIYDEMEAEGVIQVQGQTIISGIVLSKHLRMSMITGGFVKLPDGGKYVSVGDSKIKICEDRLHEYMEQGIHKAVIGCRFIPELRAVALAAKRQGFKVELLHGGVKKGRERQDRIDRFNNSTEPTVFISQIAAGSQAINLSSADTMMFYSMDESYLLHDQFSKRIEKYNDDRTLQYDFLVARGTRDEVTLEALSLKQDVATYMYSHPKRVQELSRR